MRQRQTFKNESESPVYIYIEPWPECFELEPQDKVTIIFDGSKNGDSLQVDFLNSQELVIWPPENIEDFEILFNDRPADDRSWRFKHR